MSPKQIWVWLIPRVSPWTMVLLAPCPDTARGYWYSTPSGLCILFTKCQKLNPWAIDVQPIWSCQVYFVFPYDCILYNFRFWRYAFRVLFYFIQRGYWYSTPSGLCLFFAICLKSKPWAINVQPLQGCQIYYVFPYYYILYISRVLEIAFRVLFYFNEIVKCRQNRFGFSDTSYWNPGLLMLDSFGGCVCCSRFF